MGGIGLILSKTKVPVQPLRISGAYEAFPIGARFPKLHPVTVTVGDPIPFTPAELNARGKEAYQHLTDRIMDAIRALPAELSLLPLPHDLQAEINGLPLLRKLLLADSAAGGHHPGKQRAGKNQPAGSRLLPAAPAIPAHRPARPAGRSRKAGLRHPRRAAGAGPAHLVDPGRSGPPRQRRAAQGPAQLSGGQLPRGMDGE